MVQLNKLLKSMWRALGANLDQNTVAIVADAIEGLKHNIYSVDKHCALSAPKGCRSNRGAEKKVQITVKDLVDKSLFHHTTNSAGYLSFPKASSNLLVTEIKVNG